LDAERRDVGYEYFLRSIPPEELLGMKIYMVKPEDEWTEGGQCRSSRARFVAILRSGDAHCTCCLDRYSGMLCSHIFAVLRHAARSHSVYFRMGQIHPLWYAPAVRLGASTTDIDEPIYWSRRPPNDIGSDTENDEPTPSHSQTSPLKERDRGLQPQTPNQPSFPGTSLMSRKKSVEQLSPAKRRRTLSATVHAKCQKLTDLGPSEKTLQIVSKMLEGEIEKREDEMLTAGRQNPLVTQTLHDFFGEGMGFSQDLRDPPVIYGPGAKSKARIKSSHEKKKKKTKKD
jgi:hypothetical protein